MTLEISSQMTQVASVAGLWTAAHELAGSQNCARVLMLRSKLQCTRKGVMIMVDYLGKIKKLSQSLALAGSAVP